MLHLPPDARTQLVTCIKKQMKWPGFVWVRFEGGAPNLLGPEAFRCNVVQVYVHMCFFFPPSTLHENIEYTLSNSIQNGITYTTLYLLHTLVYFSFYTHYPLGITFGCKYITMKWVILGKTTKARDIPSRSKS